MPKNNSTFRSGEKILYIDLWSVFYLLMVYVFTLVLGQANILVFALYLIGALPFIHHLDRFTCICFLLSTMSYYFLGADEGVWSLYSVLAVLMILRMLTDKIHLPLKVGFCFLWIIVAIALSYARSVFGYSMGMFAMIYNIVITILVAITVKIDKDTISSFLPRITAFQIVVYAGLLLMNGHYDGYGYSIAESINHNTFGASVSILSVMIFAKILFFEGKAFYKIIWALSLVLVLATGSRNALLAMVLTSVIMYLISVKQRGKTISGGLKFLVAVCVIAFLGSSLLPLFGFDLSRYDYVELLNTGGSNRAIIWETMAPVIWRDHRWFGYGPSHFCSEQMINIFMNLDYKHTHNTIFEAWGELGLFGLIPFLLLLWMSLKKSWQYVKRKNAYLVLGFILLEFLLLSIGESFFANIEIWMIIGLLLSTKNKLEESKNNEALDQEVSQ